MKTSRFLLFFSLLLLLGSCTKNARLTVLQPAEMTIPEHISTVAVVDRSKPANGWLNVLEGVLTGEAIGQDRQSRDRAVQGLTEALTRTPRFKVKQTGIEMSGSKAGNNLPAPLDWPEIERICRQYDADAVVTIESFDSDNSTSTRAVQNKRKDKNGKEYIETSYEGRQRTGVRMGWRMYDPTKRIIIDEFVTDDYLERNSTGATERAALNNLPSQVGITRDVARMGGASYGMRIAPVFVQVNRAYYSKGKGVKSEMKQAVRFAQAGNWDKAAEIWNKLAQKSDVNRKAAGRAAYNMAVAAEMKGQLELAQEWAEKSWTQFGNKRARGYIQTLKMRQNDVRRVDEQMHHPKKA
jgi:hypothetical protein